MFTKVMRVSRTIGILCGLLCGVPTGAAMAEVVAEYPLSTYAEDISGHGNHGSYGGTQAVQNRLGAPNEARDFDGVDDRVFVAESEILNPTDGIIVEAWVYPRSYPTNIGNDNHKQILMKEAQYQLVINADSTVVFAIGPHPWVLSHSLEPIPLDEWSYVRGEFDFATGDLSLYVNGELQETVNRALTSWSTWGGLYIGMNPSAAEGYHFDGMIDDVRISSLSDVIAEYPLDTYAKDISGHANHGIVFGTDPVPDWQDVENEALTFDGVDDYIYIAESPELNPPNGVVVEAWVYPMSHPTHIGHDTQRQILMKEAQYQLLVQGDSTVSFGIGPHPWGHAKSMEPIPLNEWSLIRGEFDFATRRVTLYVNGELQDSEYRDLTSWVTAGGMYIGKNPSAAEGYYFDGSLAELTISDDVSVDPPCWVGMTGNVNGNSADAPDLSDLIYLVNYLFLGGPAPVCMVEANIDGDPGCNTDLSDLIYLVNFLFLGGTAPADCDPACEAGAGTTNYKVNPEIEVSCSFDGDATVVELVSGFDIRGVALTLEGDGSGKLVRLCDPGLELYSSWSGTAAAVGILDIDGPGIIRAGSTQLVRLEGRCEITSALVTDMNFVTLRAGIGGTNLAASSLPTDFALSQNYPNPFNPSTEISFSLPEACDVRLEVFNVLGQRVATLINGRMGGGTHSVRWDATATASGVYLYRLQAGEFVENRKMILLK